MIVVMKDLFVSKIVCTNKKAYHDYTIDTVYEAGMELRGSEVKSLRAGKANLRDGYAKIKGNEIWLHSVHISPYSHATYDAPDSVRLRKLLLHRREINKLIGKVQGKGYSLIPLKIYFNERGKAKVALGLAKGKRSYDKRASVKDKDMKRDVERVMQRY